MSRRTQHDPGFGSDSFLDVLANMVGILIILIVIAGVQVGRAPILSLASPTAVELESPAPEISPAPAPPVEEPVEESEPAPESDAPPVDVARGWQAVESEISEIRAQQSAIDAELEKVRSRYAAARQTATSAEQLAASLSRELGDDRTRVARLQQSLGDRKAVLTGLLAEFEEAASASPPAKQFRHHLAPISQEVQGEEVHFRLYGNRVSVIPLPQLVERVKFQLERQKDWLARHAKHEGTVGPVDGYSLKYLVERQQLSPMEERKLGYGAFRVGVSSWELIPDADVPAETAEQALRRGSRFAVALQAAPEKASLTFWVYPDSFGLYRKLQEAAHAEGFLVAGRPLPEGASIEGSPHGSRSAGQ